MAMYRIKPADTPEQPPAEYWREIKPEHARDLDFAEIEALNRADDDAEAEEAAPIRPFRSPWLRALLALLIVTAFALWSASGLFGERLDFGFIRRSAGLAKDQSLAALQAAVVTVDCSGSSGSGFNIRESGLIVTNAHVVDAGGIITVAFPDGSRFDTRAYHVPIEGVDLAVVDIDGSGLPAVVLSDEAPAAGDPLLFIGNPLGFDWTISEAEMNAVVLLGEVQTLYFSGPVRSGSSGSPVFDQNAEVVGVIFATLRGEEDSGLAIPISYLNSYLEETDEY